MRLSWAGTMAGPWRKGNRGRRLFPSLLRGLPAIANRGRESVEHQLFNNDLMRLSNSSKLWSPFIISPLMKKVGVEFTFNTSFAYF